MVQMCTQLVKFGFMPQRVALWIYWHAVCVHVYACMRRVCVLPTARAMLRALAAASAVEGVGVSAKTFGDGGIERETASKTYAPLACVIE